MGKHNTSSFKYIENISNTTYRASELVTNIIISLFASRLSYIYSNHSKLVDFHGFSIPAESVDLFVLISIISTLTYYLIYALKNLYFIIKINHKSYRDDLIKEVVTLSKTKNQNSIKDVELSLLKYTNELDIIETRNSANKVIEITLLPKNRTAFWLKINNFEIDIIFDPKRKYVACTYRERGILLNST